MPEGEKHGGATSKGWAESAPHGWNRATWSAKNDLMGKKSRLK